MKVKFLKLPVICIFMFSFLFTAVSFAQENKKISNVRETYIISAKAGSVNFVSGDAFVAQTGGKNISLKKGDEVDVGDRVSTGAAGKAEVLLNPGSFVRLGGSSEFEFLTTDLDDLQVRLNSGSAIFEVLATDEFRVTVTTPKSRFFIVRTGVYRVDALADGTAKVEVWKGRVQIDEGGKGKIIKDGRTAIINNVPNAQLAIAKFDRDDKDEFDLWSRERAKELDKVNAKLQGRQMNRALMSAYSAGRWSINSSFGLWVFDPFSRSFCFLPFGYGWRSPYGHYYNRSLWNYQQTMNTVYANNPNWNPSNGGGQGGGTPPYQTVQPGNGGGGGGSSAPYNPPPMAPAPRGLDVAPSRPTITERKEIDRAPQLPRVD